MSLKPKRVDFNLTWKDLKETVKGVITFSNVPRAVWNDRFSGIFIASFSIMYYISQKRCFCREFTVAPRKTPHSLRLNLLSSKLLVGLLTLIFFK